MKPSMAIAYNMKRKPKKMAEGGDPAKPASPYVDPKAAKDFVKGFNKPHSLAEGFANAKKELGFAEGGSAHSQRRGREALKGVHTAPFRDKPGQSGAGLMSQKLGSPNQHTLDRMAKEEHQEKLSELRSMTKPKLYADGGQIEDNWQSAGNPHGDGDLMGDAHYDAEMESGFMDHEGDMKRPNASALFENDKDLGQMGENETGPMGAYAEGGMAGEQTDSHMMDMIGRIISKRCYSKGGEVANDTPIVAGHKPNQFDDLVLRDDLESSYDGDNAGDHLGNAQESEDRKDIVSRVMKSRAKKDRMPRPA